MIKITTEWRHVLEYFYLCGANANNFVKEYSLYSVCFIKEHIMNICRGLQLVFARPHSTVRCGLWDGQSIVLRTPAVSLVDYPTSVPNGCIDWNVKNKLRVVSDFCTVLYIINDCIVFMSIHRL